MPGINIRVKLYTRAIKHDVDVTDVVNRLLSEYLDGMDAEKEG